MRRWVLISTSCSPGPPAVATMIRGQKTGLDSSYQGASYGIGTGAMVTFGGDHRSGTTAGWFAGRGLAALRAGTYAPALARAPGRCW
jgi:hypothetical protein